MACIHTTQFLSVCLCSPFNLQLQFFHWRPGKCLQVSESVHGLFKRMPGLPSALCLTQMDRIPDDFYSQMLWGSSLWHWCSGLGRNSIAKISLQILNYHTWMGCSSFPISATLTGSVASSINLFLSIIITIDYVFILCILWAFSKEI